MIRRLVVAAVILAGAVAVLGGVPPASAAPLNLRGVVQISNGNGFACARLSSGQARCWGKNDLGQLGNGDAGVNAVYPVAVRNTGDTGNLTGVARISAGADHACATLTSGNVVCWGENGDGQLGNDSFTDSDVPTTVANAAASGPLTDVAAVSAGGLHTCARLTGGQARCWGNDLTGQLGNGSGSADAPRPVTVLNAAGTAALNGVAEIAAGLGYSCARLTVGQARCWGAGDRIGRGSDTGSNLPVVVAGVSSATLTGVSRISTGWQHGCAALTTGRLVCWGRNSEGRLGDGTTTDRLRPVVVRNPSGSGDLADITQVGPASSHTCARQSSGRVFCWGANTSGSLGNGNQPFGSLLPVVVRNVADTAALGSVVEVTSGASAASCARVTNGGVRCWGFNAFGGLGNGTTAGSDLPVVVRSE